MPARLLMTVIHRDQVRDQHSFEGNSVMIGRSAPCQVVLQDAGISRIHAEISLEDGTWYLNDLGSANGTRLNDTRQERAPLKDGDVIGIGDFSLHVAITAPGRQLPAEPAPGATDRTIRASVGKPRS